MTGQPLRTESIRVGLIHVPDRMRRHVEDERVGAIARSMRQIGLRTPITIFHGEHTDDDGEVYSGPILIAGHHRLEAAKKLDWTHIDCVVMVADEIDRRLWEISENFHRSELTVAERSEHLAEWVRLTDAKGAQVAHPTGGKQPHSKGISAAARELNVDRRDVQRATKIDSIAPEAKQAAKAAKLDDNQSALLKVAAAPPERQVQEVQRIAEQKSQSAGTPFERLARGLEWFAKLDADKIEFPPMGDVGPLELLDTVKAAEATLRKLRSRVEALP